MATQNNLHVPEELLVELRTKAAAEGRSVDELASAALRKGLDDRAWQEILSYGLERGRAISFSEEKAGDIVHEWRKQQL